MVEDELNSSSELPYPPTLPGKAPASKAPKNTVATKAPTGRGKGGGKSQSKAPIISTEPSESTLLSTPAIEPVKSGKGKGKGGGKPKQLTGKTDVPPAVKERPKIQSITPPGAEIGTATQKPPYTYASLITQALAAQADEDGKMLVSEMCEWMAGVYPFYGAKEKGSDWQSAVRHNLNADKRFKRIERTPTDGGKGNFWTLRKEEWSNFDGLELKRLKFDAKAVVVNGLKPEVKAVSGPQAEVNKPSSGISAEVKTVVPRAMDSATSRSIGSVARSDLGAHHRLVITHPASTPSSLKPVTHSQGLRPPPPAPNLGNELPILAADEPVDQSLPVTDDLMLEHPTVVEPEVTPQPKDLTNHHPVILTGERCTELEPKSTKQIIISSPPRLPLIPRIDPNLLACKSVAPPTISSNPPTLSSTPLEPPSPTPPPPTTTNSSPKVGSTKFQIVVQEPTGSSASTSSTPKTPEELKKLIESEPPMYTEGNKLILNRLIFKELKPSQIASLEKLGAQSAVKILQKFIIGYFKERIKKTASTANHDPSTSTSPVIDKKSTQSLHQIESGGMESTKSDHDSSGSSHRLSKRKVDRFGDEEKDGLDPPIAQDPSPSHEHQAPIEAKRIKLQPG